MNNKVILYGLIIVAVLLVAFNFNKITGQATKEPTTSMAVEKVREGSKFAKMTDAGEVKVMIYGSQGNCVDRTLSLYQKRAETSRDTPLSTSIEVKKDADGNSLPVSLCQKVVYMYGMQGKHGDFYFEAKDLNTGKPIRAEFNLP